MSQAVFEGSGGRWNGRASVGRSACSNRGSMMTLRNPVLRIVVIACELVTLGVALALLTAPGREGSASSIIAGSSVAVLGTGLWAYLFMAHVSLRQDVLVIRGYKKRLVPIADVSAVVSGKGPGRPAVQMSDGRIIYLGPFVSPFTFWGFGERRTQALVERLADSLDVPVLEVSRQR